MIRTLARTALLLITLGLMALPLQGCAAMAGAFIGSSISHALFEKPKTTTTTCTTDANFRQTCVTVQP